MTKKGNDQVHSRSKTDALILILFSGFLFFVSLGARDLWNPNEAIYGRATAEMAERGDWLIPTINGKVFAEKPILYYWSALSSAKLFGGIGEFSLRVPSALAGMLSVWLTYLLVLPYAGRRRALLTAVLLATSWQVFWASRAIQMDILVLASTLGVLVPLTRMLDFQTPPWRAWFLAGIAAGLGFTAKGPVALILPALIFCGYAVVSNRFAELWRPQILIAAVTAIVVGSPWYLKLWSQGETAFLYEMLIHQNFVRFVSAWDHVQPWWYYFKYIFIDFAPWSLLLPAALFVRAESGSEDRLHRLSWVWIVAVIVFFSFSDSKRAPYILPLAPAVAVLVSGVFERLAAGRMAALSRHLAVGALAFMAVIFIFAGPAVVIYKGKIPAEFVTLVSILAGMSVLVGIFIAGGILLQRHAAKTAPLSLLTGITAIYLVIVILLFPAMNAQKSERRFIDRLLNELHAHPSASVALYRCPYRHAGYVYYAQRNMQILNTPEQLASFWHENPTAYLIVEAPIDDEMRELFPEISQIYRRKIGSREAFLFAQKPGFLMSLRSDPEIKISQDASP